MKTRPVRKPPKRRGAASPITIDAGYLCAVARIESLPENRSGADKTWVERALARWRAHYGRAIRIR
jgi:hypothetical protein